MSVHVTNAIPVTLNDLLVKLNILSMLESGKKVNIGNLSFTNSFSWLDASTWMSNFNRKLEGESKKSLIIHLNQIIGQAIAAIDEYRYTEFCGIIVNHLSQARVGIQSLTVTYATSPKTVANINVCLTNIDLQLRKNQELLMGHQSKTPEMDRKKLSESEQAMDPEQEQYM